MPIFADYRPPRESLEDAGKPNETVEMDRSWLALVTHWRLVTADLADRFHLDLHDPAVLARPWPGVRTLIFSLLDSDTRIRAALTRR